MKKECLNLLLFGGACFHADPCASAVEGGALSRAGQSAYNNNYYATAQQLITA